MVIDKSSTTEASGKPLVIGPKVRAELRKDLARLAEKWALEGSEARRREITLEISKICELLKGAAS